MGRSKGTGLLDHGQTRVHYQLEMQKHNHHRLLESWWNAKIVEQTSQVELAIKELNRQHYKDESGIASVIRDLEKRLSNHLKHAPVVGNHARDGITMKLKKEIDNTTIQLRNLRKRHQVQRMNIADKATRRWEKLVAVRDKELALLDQKMTNAQKSSSRYETIKQRTSAPSNPMGPHFTAVAYGDYQVKSVVATSHLINSLENIESGSHNFVRQVRPKSGVTRPLTATQHPKHKQRPSTAPQRKSCSSSRKGPACRFCGVRSKTSKGSDYVSIPQEGRGTVGVGLFCSWECAKAWNHVRSPTQLRWTRDLFIDEVAQRQVQPRARSAMKANVAMEAHPFKPAVDSQKSVSGSQPRKTKKTKKKSKRRSIGMPRKEQSNLDPRDE